MDETELEDLIHSNEIFAGDLRTILENFLKKRDPRLFTSMIQLIVGWQLCRQLPDFDDVTKIELKIYKGDQVAFNIKASDTTLLAIGPNGERNATDEQ